MYDISKWYTKSGEVTEEADQGLLKLLLRTPVVGDDDQVQVGDYLLFGRSEWNDYGSLLVPEKIAEVGYIEASDYRTEGGRTGPLSGALFVNKDGLLLGTQYMPHGIMDDMRAPLLDALASQGVPGRYLGILYGEMIESQRARQTLRTMLFVGVDEDSKQHD